MTARTFLAVLFAAAVIGCVHVFVQWCEARARWDMQEECGE